VGIEAQSRQIDRCSHEITSEPVKAVGVLWIDGGLIVNGEAGITPRKEQVDALLGDELAVLEELRTLCLKRSSARWASTKGIGCHEPSSRKTPRVTMEWMCGFHFKDEENVWMTATMPGRASGSSTTAAIISRTVS
jgi:hypothetical protein